MRLKILGLFAALLLVAACQTAPEDSASGEGEGGTEGGASVESAGSGDVSSGDMSDMSDKFLQKSLTNSNNNDNDIISNYPLEDIIKNYFPE